MMLCFEWWAFAFISVIAGVIGVNELAAHTIFQNIIVLFHNISLGLQTAVCAKIGFEVGRLDVQRAKAYRDVAYKIVFFQIAGTFIALYLFLSRFVK
jgi:Na+-driven multidrug efflux pump